MHGPRSARGDGRRSTDRREWRRTRDSWGGDDKVVAVRGWRRGRETGAAAHVVHLTVEAEGELAAERFVGAHLERGCGGGGRAAREAGSRPIDGGIEG